MEVIFKVIVVSGLALAPAVIATKKGRDFCPWAIYGFLVWPIAIIHACVLSRKDKDTIEDRIDITQQIEPKRPWGRAGASEQ
jgi:hypothetical protein